MCEFISVVGLLFTRKSLGILQRLYQSVHLREMKVEATHAFLRNSHCITRIKQRKPNPTASHKRSKSDGVLMESGIVLNVRATAHIDNFQRENEYIYQICSG